MGFHKIYSRIEYPSSEPTEDIFERFRNHYPLDDDRFSIAIAVDPPRSVILLCGDEEVHCFVKLLLIGTRDLDQAKINIYEGK